MSDDNAWAQRFEQHAAVQAMRQLAEATRGFPEEPSDIVQLEHLERARRVVDALSRSFDSVDPELVAPQVLDALAPALQQAQTAAQQYGSNPDTTPLQQLNGHLDTVLTHVRAGLQPTETDAEIESAREQARSYRASAGQYLRGVREEADAASQRIAELQQTIDERLGQLDEKTAGMEQASQQKLDALSADLDQLKSTIEAQKTRVDTSIQEFQQQFSDSQEKRRESFQASTKEHAGNAAQALETLETQTEQRLATFTEESQAAVDTIRELKEEVEQLAAATGGAALGGHHKQQADDEQRQADTWRWIAVLGALVVTVVGALAYLQQPDQGEWQQMLQKLLVALPVGAVAAYAGRQSSRHRGNSERARDIQLDLLALGPYLATLDSAVADDIRTVVALRVFGRDTTGSGEEESPSGLDTAVSAIRSLAEQRRAGGSDE